MKHFRVATLVAVALTSFQSRAAETIVKPGGTAVCESLFDLKLFVELSKSGTKDFSQVKNCWSVPAGVKIITIESLSDYSLVQVINGSGSGRGWTLNQLLELKP